MILLIETFGIEIRAVCMTQYAATQLLIEPFGIEIAINTTTTIDDNNF